MKRKVLEAFDYAYDGVRVNRLKANRLYEIRDEHVERFEAEGKIEPTARSEARSRAETVLTSMTDAEDAAITAAALSDPDAQPVSTLFRRKRKTA